MPDQGNQSGFNIIELMIAIVILVVAIISLQAVLISHHVTSRINKETNSALNEARRQMELVKAQAFHDLVDGVTTFDVTHGAKTLNRIDANTAVGSITIATEEEGRIKRIIVTTAWRSAKKRDRTVSLSTFKSEH